VYRDVEFNGEADFCDRLLGAAFLTRKSFGEFPMFDHRVVVLKKFLIAIS
jgi:hypothetical protein